MSEALDLDAVDTYTPILWAMLSDEDRYAEYIRIRRELERLRVMELFYIEQMHSDQARKDTP